MTERNLSPRAEFSEISKKFGVLVDIFFENGHFRSLLDDPWLLRCDRVHTSMY